MSNIVSISGRNRHSMGRNTQAVTAVSAAEGSSTSPLLFNVYERPLWYEGKHGSKFSNTQHKGLVRLNSAGEPVCLNVVRDTYKVVQNAELFDKIHEGMLTGVTREELASATIHDRIAYDGKVCFREYQFRDISVNSPENDTIAFRVIVQNGFGTGAIKLFAGAIDFFCTNGMILGEYSRTYAKHTKGLQINQFKEAVEGSVQLFWKNKHMYGELAGKKVLSDDVVRKWYEHHFGDRLGLRLFHQYLVEKVVRGSNLWSVYSALTFYSSHNACGFETRNTGNDHVASTMMKRETDVQRVFADIQQLAA